MFIEKLRPAARTTLEKRPNEALPKNSNRPGFPARGQVAISLMEILQVPIL